MPQSSLRVLVIGAGLGGLCLAQGLRKAGVEVAVYERDTGLAIRTQGHRSQLKSPNVNLLCLTSLAVSCYYLL